MKQARFWTDHKGSAVRLKINAGQMLCHSYGGQTDEGYSWTFEAYQFDGHAVAVQWRTDSRDCDGRMERTGSAYCPVAKLSSGYACPETGLTFPAWSSSEGCQRDYSAEAMGY